MTTDSAEAVFDYVIIGSGFGGSISAMRLAQKGYTVLILEQGKRFRDEDFAKTNWDVGKYLWAPALRCFGILEISPFKDVIALHGAGVGGGSLGYANVLMRPNEQLFNNPSWKHLADWKKLLEPHYATASRMLGITENPRLWTSDQVVLEIASELGTKQTFIPAPVGIFFGEQGQEGAQTPDPFFYGAGPARRGCTHCGACMIGCRYNAKNTLLKNYLYFAEKWGAEIRAECCVRDVRPLMDPHDDQARYTIFYHKTTRWMTHPVKSVRARNVIFSAGAIGTQKLLFHCRDVSKSLPEISPRLGSMVRTNNESLLGVVSKDDEVDYSKGVAITSFFYADPETAVEPVRYPAGSSFMRFLSGPLVEIEGSFGKRLWTTLKRIFSKPMDFMRTHVLPGWAQRTTILLVMQTRDNHLQMRLGRSLFTLFRKRLVSDVAPALAFPAKIDLAHHIARRFAEKIDGIPAGTINEGVLNVPMTAHILGGCPFGVDDQEGVIDLDCQVFHYPGLYVIDGSIMPANPGVNPSLTISALAEYAMSRIPSKPGGEYHSLELRESPTR